MHIKKVFISLPDFRSHGNLKKSDVQEMMAMSVIALFLPTCLQIPDDGKTSVRSAVE